MAMRSPDYIGGQGPFYEPHRARAASPHTRAGHGPHCEIYAEREGLTLFYRAKWHGTRARRRFATEAEARAFLAICDVRPGYLAQAGG